VALAPLIVAIAIEADARSGRGRSTRLFGLGIVAGVVHFAINLYWVGTVMGRYGGFSEWIAVAIAALLCFYLAVFVGLFSLTLGAAVRRFGVAGVYAAPACWVAFEWVRSWFFGGFPWVMLGTSQARVSSVVQIASVVGVYGLSALVALVSAAAAAMALSRRTRYVAIAGGVAALLGLVAAFGFFRIAGGSLVQTGTVLRVGLLQGNVEQLEKWDAAYRDTILQRYLQLSRQAIGGGARLVIWPEASTPFIFDARSDLAAPIRRLAVESRTPFLIGSDELEANPAGGKNRIYNAAVLVGADGRSHGSYRKINLVPFGEYVPLQRLLFFIAPLVESVSDFSAGTEPVVLDDGGVPLSVSICYESIMPWLSRAFVQRGSQLLVTITNDAWFGNSSAPYQHFDQGLIRAVEEGRFVVRAANTGISGVVDPYGRVLLTTRLFEAAAPTFDVRLLTGRTIYSYIGDVAAYFSVLVTAWVAFMARRRRS
jgi:apolipoprotein N-acyltransferase